LTFWGRIPTPVAIEVKFCAAKRTQVPVGPAKFDVNRCNESSLRAKNLIFGLWSSKFKTGSLPLRGNKSREQRFGHVNATNCNSYLNIILLCPRP